MRATPTFYDAWMHPLLRSVVQDREILLAVAAPVEIAAVFRALGDGKAGVPGLWERVQVREGVSLVHLGVGKANAAGGLAQGLRSTDGLVLNVGIGGALPGADGGFRLSPGETVVGEASVFADEGLETDEGFADVATIGFPIDPEVGSRFVCEPRVIEAFGSSVTARGVIATVSTCSATDGLAMEMSRRTGAIAETMEGAACGLVARRRGVAFGEVRAISNYTGARANQQWDIKGALASLERVLRATLA